MQICSWTCAFPALGTVPPSICLPRFKCASLNFVKSPDKSGETFMSTNYKRATRRSSSVLLAQQGTEICLQPLSIFTPASAQAASFRIPYSKLPWSCCSGCLFSKLFLNVLNLSLIRFSSLTCASCSMEVSFGIKLEKPLRLKVSKSTEASTNCWPLRA